MGFAWGVGGSDLGGVAREVGRSVYLQVSQRVLQHTYANSQAADALSDSDIQVPLVVYTAWIPSTGLRSQRIR